VACIPAFTSFNGRMSTLPALGGAISAPRETPDTLAKASVAKISHVFIAVPLCLYYLPIRAATLADELTQLGSRAGTRLAPLRTRGNRTDLDSRAFLEKLQIRASLLREILETRDAARRGLPARQLLIQRLDAFKRAIRSRHFVDFLAVDPISDTHRNLGELI